MSKKLLITLFILFLTSNVFAKNNIDEIKNLYMTGHHKKAYRLCIEALKVDYSDYEAHYYLGLCYLSFGQLNDAKVEFKNVIEIAPGTKLAAYSTQGLQNIFDEQTKEYSSGTIAIVGSKSKTKKIEKSSYKKPRVRKVKSKGKVALDGEDNYFFNVLNAEGKIVRWDNSLPINIYIPMENFGYDKTIKEAFGAWNSAYQGLKFEYINNPQAAHISVFLKDKLTQNTNMFDKGGYAKPTYEKGRLKKVEIHAETKGFDGKRLHNSSFYNVMLHEIGHSLGVWGHSDKMEDIMFPIGMPSVRKAKLSQRDINTIKALYESDADITNKKKSRGKGSILASNKTLQASAKEQKIAEDKRYAELIPDDPDNWVKLGYTYNVYGEPYKALESYSKALAINPAHEVALEQSASVYWDLKKYPHAANTYKKLVKIKPDEVKYYQNLVGLYLNLQKTNEAQYWYDKMVRQNPNSRNDKKSKELLKQLKERKKT